MPKDVVITGASGQIGKALVQMLAARGHKVTAITRSHPMDLSGAAAVHTVDLAKDPLPNGILTDDSVVLHLAGTVPREVAPVDTDETLNVAIARNLVQSRPRRLVMLSSLSASVAQQTPAIARQYGREKLAVERVISEALPENSFVILRPPAIYGPGIRGPIAQLAILVRRGMPLPLALATAARPYLALDNLLTLFEAVVEADATMWDGLTGTPVALHDGQMVRTCDLVRHLAAAQGKRALLLPVPLGFLRVAGRLTRRKELVSGAIDPVPGPINLTRLADFGWKPSAQMPETLTYLERI